MEQIKYPNINIAGGAYNKKLNLFFVYNFQNEIYKIDLI